jgi:hypothetical protein
MNIFNKVGLWFGIAAIVFLVVALAYILNVFEAEPGEMAEPPLVLPSPHVDQVMHYTELSQVASYIIHGRVQSILSQTKQEITPTGTSTTILVHYNSFLVEVIQSIPARGNKNNYPLPQGIITIRQQVTSHSPKFSVGEAFIAFLKLDLTTGTYYVVGLSGGAREGKLSVTLEQGEARIRSGETVSQFFQIVQATQ